MTRPLRLALFSGNYNYVRDGANQAQNLLVRYLLDHGVAVRVYSPLTDRPAFKPEGDVVEVPNVPMPGRGEYKLGRGLPAAPRRDLEAFAPDIVHVSAPEFLGHAAVTWARRHQVPAIAAVHTRFDSYFRYYKLGFVEPAVIWIMRRFYNRCDRVLVPTPSIGELARREWGVTVPISLWPRGVDHARFNPGRRDMAWRRSLGIADGELAIGFLGRLVLEKGLDVFAEVLAALRARGVPHRALIVGTGPAQEQFARLAPDAVFAGFQSGDDLARAVASMDVLFNPSITETWGQVTSEAMAAGVPVVAARATGAIDLVEDGVTGFLVTPQDVGAYAEAIARLAADPALRASASAASVARAAAYRWDDANARVLEAYEAVLAARQS